MRRAAKVDQNQAQVVSVLRGYGASVQSLAAVGKGVPDLLVGYRGKTYLLEVKDGNKLPSQTKLTPDQQDWHLQWKGDKPVIVYSPTDAIKAILADWGAKPSVSLNPESNSAASKSSGQ